MRTNARRFATIATLATAALAVSAVPAHAESGSLTGSVNRGNTNLVVGETKRTMPNLGSISIKYTNGLGATNNVSLRIGPIRHRDGFQFSDSKVMGPGTGQTYTLATEVRRGTEFRLQWRPSENVFVDTQWGGTINWG